MEWLNRKDVALAALTAAALMAFAPSKAAAGISYKAESSRHGEPYLGLLTEANVGLVDGISTVTVRIKLSPDSEVVGNEIVINYSGDQVALGGQLLQLLHRPVEVMLNADSDVLVKVKAEGTPVRCEPAPRGST